jgi:hypothetical protein
MSSDNATHHGAAKDPLVTGTLLDGQDAHAQDCDGRDPKPQSHTDVPQGGKGKTSRTRSAAGVGEGSSSSPKGKKRRDPYGEAPPSPPRGENNPRSWSRPGPNHLVWVKLYEFLGCPKELKREEVFKAFVKRYPSDGRTGSDSKVGSLVLALLGSSGQWAKLNERHGERRLRDLSFLMYHPYTLEELTRQEGWTHVAKVGDIPYVSVLRPEAPPSSESKGNSSPQTTDPQPDPDPFLDPEPDSEPSDSGDSQEPPQGDPPSPPSTPPEDPVHSPSPPKLSPKEYSDLYDYCQIHLGRIQFEWSDLTSCVKSWSVKTGRSMSDRVSYQQHLDLETALRAVFKDRPTDRRSVRIAWERAAASRGRVLPSHPVARIKWRWWFWKTRVFGGQLFPSSSENW